MQSSELTTPLRRIQSDYRVPPFQSRWSIVGFVHTTCLGLHKKRRIALIETLSNSPEAEVRRRISDHRRRRCGRDDLSYDTGDRIFINVYARIAANIHVKGYDCPVQIGPTAHLQRVVGRVKHAFFILLLR